jgi:hypothetical protein
MRKHQSTRCTIRVDHAPEVQQPARRHSAERWPRDHPSRVEPNRRWQFASLQHNLHAGAVGAFQVG